MSDQAVQDVAQAAPVVPEAAPVLPDVPPVPENGAETTGKGHSRASTKPKYAIPADGLEDVPLDYFTGDFQALRVKDFKTPVFFHKHKVNEAQNALVKAQEALAKAEHEEKNPNAKAVTANADKILERIQSIINSLPEDQRAAYLQTVMPMIAGLTGPAPVAPEATQTAPVAQ